MQSVVLSSADLFLSSRPGLWWAGWCLWWSDCRSSSCDVAPWWAGGGTFPSGRSTCRYARTWWCRSLLSLKSMTRHSYVPSSDGFTLDRRSLWEMLLPATFTTYREPDRRCVQTSVRVLNHESASDMLIENGLRLIWDEVHAVCFRKSDLLRTFKERH